MDVLSEIAFGQPFGYIDKQEEHELFDMIETTENAMPIMSVVSMVPWIIKFLQSPLFKPFRPSERESTGLGKMKMCATLFPLC